MDGARAFIGKRHVYHKHGIVLWGRGTWVSKDQEGRGPLPSLASLTSLSVTLGAVYGGPSPIPTSYLREDIWIVTGSHSLSFFKRDLSRLHIKPPTPPTLQVHTRDPQGISQ